MILHYTTSKEVWLLLGQFLSPLCSIHNKALRSKLQAFKKKIEITVFEYLMDIRGTIDALHAMGSTISNK